MNIIKISLLAFFLFANIASSAPIDYNNDSYSDPSTVVASSSLSWESIINSQYKTVLSSFGSEDHHVVPGQYLNHRTLPATIDSTGTWRFSNRDSINFGDAEALFLAGADFDGDKKTDLAYSTNSCNRAGATFNVLVNPLGEDPTLHVLPASRGHLFKTYYDSNNDQIDEICTLLPIKTRGQFTSNFRIRCHNAITKSITSRFNLGHVNNQPLRIKVKNQADLLVIFDQTNESTRLRVINNQGQRVLRTTLSAVGEILIGNYTSQDSEQIAIVKDGQAVVYDLLQKSVSNLIFPEGTPYDQINIVNFKNDDDCFCTSKRINKNKSCNQTVVTPPAPPAPAKDFFIPDNCSNPPEYITANDGFKCIASSTRGGSIVCLLPYQFTWAPHRNVTDHHGYTFACNKNDDHFDSVSLVLRSGEKVPLAFAYCANYVATTEGPIGRQHFRNEDYQWNSVSSQAVTLEMIKDGKKTCLRF